MPSVYDFELPYADQAHLISALLAEIKEIFDKRSQHDDMLMSAISGRQQPIVPHLEFLYPDASIHEDLYQLIKYSCGEVCTSEQLDKVLKIWTTFLEPLLGVPPRPQAIEETRDDAKNKEKVTGVMNNDVREKGEQSNPLNEDGKSLSEHSTSRNDDTVVKGNGSGSTAHETDNICDTCQHVNVPNECAMPDKICKSNKPAVSDQMPSDKAGELDSANAENTSRTCAKEPGYATTEFDGLKMRAAHEIQSAGGTRPESSSGRTNLIQKHKGGPTAHFKIEREEGELSPTGDFEEDNFEECSEMELDAKDSAGSRQHLIASEVGDIHVQDAVGENYADEEGEASAHRLSEESETAPGNVDVSASESAEVDCSPEQADEDGANDNKIESEGEVEALANDQYGEGDGGAFPERFLQRAKPVTKSKSLGSPNEKMNTQIFYGNDSFYILFRLHHIMYERLHKAKLHSSTAEHRWRASNDVDSANSYSRFMNSLYSLLDGSSENAKFEDDCRSIVGTQSYLLFTLDKLIYKIVKQLQSIATDETNNKLLQLKAYEESRSPRRFIDHFYFENVRVFLSDENVYRIECLSSPTKLSIQLMDYWFDRAEPTPVFIDSNFASYLLTEYLQPARERRIQASAHERRLPAKIYLRRNKRKYEQLDEDDAFMEAMENVYVVNKLELKMQSSSSKVSYVINTEDLLFRERKKKKISHQNGSGNSNSHHAGSSNICRSQIRG